MSHCYGSICERHHRIMVPDVCPERGCFGAHGFIPLPCQPDCPDYRPEPVTSGPTGTDDDQG